MLSRMIERWEVLNKFNTYPKHAKIFKNKIILNIIFTGANKNLTIN